MKHVTIIIYLIVSIMFLFGCQSAESKPNEKTTIYTSVYPIQYIVERIGGDTIQVSSIFPPGVDAHTFEPTLKMMTSVARSDGFIYIGSGMESFAESIANALEGESVALLEIGKNETLFEPAEEEHGHDDHNHNKHHHDGHNHGDHDPHIWIDPLRMIEMSKMITAFLIELHPEDEAYFTENLQALEKELYLLDQQFETTLSSKTNKKILVSHAAYGYWERYGIEQIAINGISSTSEPSQKDLIQIITQAKESNLKFVIFEQNTSSKVSTIIQDYINAETLTIHNLGVLTEDDIQNNENYLSLMERNLAVLDKATQ